MGPIAESVLITSAGIRNSLKRYKPLQALSEYVWNGFDAQATRVDIVIDKNVVEGIAQITVRDNGKGIERTNLELKFKPFFQSEKIYDPEVKHSATHGKNGVGRLTFFSFANLARWNTVYQKENKRSTYNIDVSATTLNDYLPSEEECTDSELGTVVTFFDIITNEITEDTAKIYLSKEFCWFLELNREKGYSIFVNGERLNYETQIVRAESINYLHESSKTTFDVRYVCWKNKLSEYSKYYYIKSNGMELAKENTTLNNKGDCFYHSVYIKSSVFDHFDFSNTLPHQGTIGGLHHKKSAPFEYIMQEVNHHLFDIRRPFIKEFVSKAVDRLEIESAFPRYDPQNVLD